MYLLKTILDLRPGLPDSFLIALIFSTVNLAVSQSALSMHDVLLQDRLHVCSLICWLKISTVIV